MSGSHILRTQALDPKMDSDWHRQLATAKAIANRHQQGFGTVLLADEVGMGKTYVALATIAQQLFQARKNDRKALLVVPPNAVLAAKWEQEIRSFNKNYLVESKATKELRPIVVRDYWELIQNLHDYDRFDIGRISSGMLECFALALWSWSDSLRKKGCNRKDWAIYGKLKFDDAAYLDFCSYCSVKSLFNFLDDRSSEDQTRFREMITALEAGAMDHGYLKALIRRFAEMQDAMESNVYVVSMASLRRTRSDHRAAKLLASYIAGKALKGKWEAKWESVFATLCKAGQCYGPGNLAYGGKHHYRWFVDLSQIDLWGMQGAVERCIDDTGASLLLEQMMAGNTLEALKSVSELVIREKLAESNISLAVIDEVHNWKNGSNGAEEFRRNYAPYIPNKLMLSATPFQLHEDELGKVFRFVAGTNDRSMQIVEAVLKENGAAKQCLAASDQFLAAWNKLAHADLVLLHGQLDAKAPSSTKTIDGYLEEIKNHPDVSDELAVFVDLVVRYRKAVTTLKNELSQIIIRHTKSRGKRHFHAGTEFARATTPDYKLKRRVMSKVAGLGDEGDGALLNYLAMRVEQLVRRDLNANKNQTNVHLLGGITSSLAAFKESNHEMLSNPNVTAPTRRYLDFFERSLESAVHPKVSATVDRALHNYKAGFKTLIFCERLKTQDEVLSKLVQRIQNEVFGARNIEDVKKDRRNLLKEHREVELYWSRSYISAAGNRHDLKQALQENAQQLQRGYDDYESRLGRLNDRQASKLIDLLALSLLIQDKSNYQAVNALLESIDALKLYLRLNNNLDEEALDEDVDGEDETFGSSNRIHDLLNSPSIWHPEAEICTRHKPFHQLIWRLVESEFIQISGEGETGDPFVVAQLLLDIGQGLRKVLLRLDTLKDVEKEGRGLLASSTIRMLKESMNSSHASPWFRTQHFLEVLVGSQGTLRRSQKQSSRRKSLWGGVFLKEERIVSELRGGVDNDTRIKRCAAFNSPLLPDILVCTAIGSEGIDLHLNCDEIIHHDLPWNPAKLEQRTGRIDRVGSLAERRFEQQPDSSRLNIGIPFLAQNYEEFQYDLLVTRAQKFEVLLGKPEFSVELEDEEVVDQDGNIVGCREAKDIGAEGLSDRADSLPEEIIEYLKMDLAIV